MRNFNIEEFKAGINRALDDGGNPILPVGVIRGAGARDWQKIREALEQWQDEGILILLADPENEESSVPCVQMIKYIHRRSAIPGFLNWDED